MKYRVLFLEDEPTIQEVLKEYMTMSGYEVTTADRGDQALTLLGQSGQLPYDIAVLDIMVPGPSGFDVLAYIKKQYPQMATIMLTALEDDKSQLHAFNLYADDYVIKPVSPIILLKRMETILRRTYPATSISNDNSSTNPNQTANASQVSYHNQTANSDQNHSVGLVLEDQSYSAYYNGTHIPLTLSEFLLLQTLYQQPHRVFNREQLILHIYNEDYIGNDRIIDAHVKNIRKKLPIACIKTVIGVGYQFQEEVSGS